MGHQIVLLIGDFTARIGDASDKQSLRPVLTGQEIKKNMKDYVKQIGKILDIDKVELHYNSEWLAKLSIEDLIKLSMNFTAQQMIQRRNFKERWEQNKPIGLHELFYPLFQGYDSVAIKADVELGGSDQLFNLEVGREMQKIHKQKIQDIMTLKMLDGLDGRKMSTSWGNVINIIDKPEDMYGKVMSMKDEQMPQYFEMAGFLPFKKTGKENPRDAKARLAKEIVRLYHGKSAAGKAAQEFSRVFQEKKIPEQMSVFKASQDKLNILDLLKVTGLASSKSEGKRLVVQKGVKINDQICEDWKQDIFLKSETIIQVGKRRFIKIERV